MMECHKYANLKNEKEAFLIVLVAVKCNFKLPVSGGDLCDHFPWQKVKDKRKKEKNGGRRG